MKKKHLILVLLFLISVTFGLSAQQYTAPKLKQNNAGNQKASARVSAITDPINQFKAPEIIPPSPDVSSLGKFGEIPVGLYSGIPSIDVPIYTISAKNINVPIGISYHAGGIRVEEIASQVGLGFALQAGGTITRTVLGRADDKVGGFLYKNTPYSPEYLQTLHSTVPNSSYAEVNPPSGRRLSEAFLRPQTEKSVTLAIDYKKRELFANSKLRGRSKTDILPLLLKFYKHLV